MKKVIAAAAFMAVLLAYTGCGDSATAVTGTLPIVTGIAVDTLASIGDTIVVMWNPIDSTLVEGYFLWTRTGIEGPWLLAATSERSPAVHIANNAAYYTVMAYNGENTSSEPGLSDNTKTTGLLEIRNIFEGRPVGFIVDLQGDSLIAGDQGDPISISISSCRQTCSFRGISILELPILKCGPGEPEQESPMWVDG